jgi:hypothetical protein
MLWIVILYGVTYWVVNAQRVMQISFIIENFLSSLYVVAKGQFSIIV